MSQQTTTTRVSIRRGDQMPDFTLESTGAGTVSSRSFYMRRNLALVFTTREDAGAWGAWLRGLDAQRERIDAEAGHALVIGPGEMPASQIFPTLIDRDGAVRERFGIDAGAGAVVITDRYGTVYHVVTGRPGDDLIAPEEIPGWLEFIACRCS